jgi:transcription termination factor NusB
MYGTFLHWALSYFSGMTDLASPHTNLGNSHLFRGTHLTNINGWREYVHDIQRYSKLVRLHPRGPTAEELIAKTIDEVLESVDRAIVIYHTDDYQSLALNNMFEKIWAHGWLKKREPVLLDKIAQWNKKNLDEMSNWEIREMLSLDICSRVKHETEYQELIAYHNPKVFKLDIHDLINNFEPTLISLLEYCGLPIVRQNFTEVYSEWISYQKHLEKDKVVNTIVDSVINNYTFDWSGQNLTLVDEAIVQMILRDLHKLELKCYNLNVFPTNTNDLRKLLIDV